MKHFVTDVMLQHHLPAMTIYIIDGGIITFANIAKIKFRPFVVDYTYEQWAYCAAFVENFNTERCHATITTKGRLAENEILKLCLILDVFA